MKKYLFSVIFIVFCACSTAQTNTFPASGNVGIGTMNPQASLHVNGTIRTNNNVKIFATSEAWSEGMLIVKPLGWAGLRFSRSDPSTGNYEGNWAIGYTGDTNNDFSISNYFAGVQYNHSIFISSSTRNVGIGTSNPTDKLSVNGTIRSREIKVDNNNWPDFVFSKDYQLPSLEETERHIISNGNLKDIPSASEVKANGILIGDFNAKLLQKIEELTLYLIQKNKEVQDLQKRMSLLENKR